jgi:hypothetical protein
MIVNDLLSAATVASAWEENGFSLVSKMYIPSFYGWKQRTSWQLNFNQNNHDYSHFLNSQQRY